MTEGKVDKDYGVPIEFSEKAQSVRDKIIQLFNNEEGWETWFSEQGVIAKRRTDEDLTAVRGDLLIPFPLVDLFRFFIDVNNSDVFNPVVLTAVNLEAFSIYSWARHIKFSKVNHIFYTHFKHQIVTIITCF
jgi:hypothetical protein